MTNFLAVWMTIAYLVQSTLSINNINNIKHLETKLTQERFRKEIPNSQ